MAAVSGGLTLAEADGFAVLSIDQPGKVNVLTRALWAELATALATLQHRTDLTGVLVQSGKFGMFLAGADLKEIAATAPGDVAALANRGHAVLAAFESLPVPTAAVIDGPALGGGLEVALACDYRVVGPHAKVQLGLPETKLDLIPGWGGTQRLPRLIDPVEALRMLLTGQSVTAVDALKLGLADGDGDGRELLTRVKADDSWRAKRHKRLGPVPLSDAARAALLAFAEGASRSLAESLAAETRGFVECVNSDAARTRIAAFFAR